MIKLTKVILEKGKSRNGGWNTSQLKCFGESFNKGWYNRLIGKKVHEFQVRRFLELKDQHLSKKGPKKKKPKTRPGYTPEFIETDPNLPWAQQYSHPNWQKRRLQILERDMFTCTKCGNDSEQLHVHHLRYFAGLFVWEVPCRLLITLCKSCHEKEHKY